MSITYDIRSDDTLVITARGALTPADLAPLRGAWRDDPRVAAVAKTLVDCRAVTTWQLPGATVREYASTREAAPHLQRPDSRLAIVADSELGYGISRMYAQSGSAYGEIEVFRAMDQAEAWLAGEPLER